MMQGIRALAVEGTIGAFGVREKPPRGGRRGDLEEEPVFGPIPERKQRVKPERRLSGGVFGREINEFRNLKVVNTGSRRKPAREILRACGEG